ncbi:MAG: hypothetical protein GWN17_05500 [Candidatus Korarchaeota archaeon]|nr:hypothetical protein [Candidatus Thorarchaeota archaeon]NIW51671.1 hypothetical protein [Candidatus Korarchaeota archaeon]
MKYEFKHITDRDEFDTQGTVEEVEVDRIVSMFPEVNPKLFTNFNVTKLAICVERDGKHSRFIFDKKEE